MALLTTLADLRSEVRRITDTEGLNDLDRHPTADIDDYINRGVAALYHLINESRGGEYYVSTATIATVSGQTAYNLDDQFYKLLGVIATFNGRKAWLVPFDANERAMLSDPNLGWIGEPFRYALSGTTIEFLPTPQAVYSVQLRFVPNAPTLDLPNESFDTIERFDDYIVYYAARLLALKDESFELIAQLTALLAEMEARVRASAPSRDMAAPPRIQDVNQAYRGFRMGRRWRWA